MSLSKLVIFHAVFMFFCVLSSRGADGSNLYPLGEPVTIDHFIGFLQHGDHEFQIPSERGCRLSWVRVALWWHNGPRGAEQSEGQWDWSSLDVKVRLANENGMKVIATLDGVPPWLLQRSKNGASEKELLAAWGDFARRVAEHYSAAPLKVDIFEIMNEANIPPFMDPYMEIFRVPKPWTTEKYADLYTKLYRTAYKAIKAENPNALISSTGISGIEIEFLRRVFDHLERSEYPDMVSFHPYPSGLGTSPPEEQVVHYYFGRPLTFLDGLYAMRHQIIDKYYGPDAKVPLMLGEFSYSSACVFPKYSTTEDEQAAYSVRTIAQALSTQMVNVFALAVVWVDRPIGQDDTKEFSTGFLRADRTQKPIYFAVKTMVEQLKGAVYVGRVNLTEGDFAYQFKRPDGKIVTIAWTMRSRAKWLVPLYKQPAAFDWMGNKIALSGQTDCDNWPEDKQVKSESVVLTDKPVYVVSEQ